MFGVSVNWRLGNLEINIIIMASFEEKVKTVVGSQSQSQTQTQTQSIVAEMKLLKEMQQHSGLFIFSSFLITIFIIIIILY